LTKIFKQTERVYTQMEWLTPIRGVIETDKGTFTLFSPTPFKRPQQLTSKNVLLVLDKPENKNQNLLKYKLLSFFQLTDFKFFNEEGKRYIPNPKTPKSYILSEKVSMENINKCEIFIYIYNYLIGRIQFERGSVFIKFMKIKNILFFYIRGATKRDEDIDDPQKSKNKVEGGLGYYQHPQKYPIKIHSNFKAIQILIFMEKFVDDQDKYFKEAVEWIKNPYSTRMTFEILENLPDTKGYITLQNGNGSKKYLSLVKFVETF